MFQAGISSNRERALDTPMNIYFLFGPIHVVCIPDRADQFGDIVLCWLRSRASSRSVAHRRYERRAKNVVPGCHHQTSRPRFSSTRNHASLYLSPEQLGCIPTFRPLQPACKLLLEIGSASSARLAAAPLLNRSTSLSSSEASIDRSRLRKRRVVPRVCWTPAKFPHVVSKTSRRVRCGAGIVSNGAAARRAGAERFEEELQAG